MGERILLVDEGDDEAVVRASSHNPNRTYDVYEAFDAAMVLELLEKPSSTAVVSNICMLDVDLIEKAHTESRKASVVAASSTHRMMEPCR